MIVHNREMQHRGLELRKGHGRDNELLSELCLSLGCDDGRLMEHLRRRKVPAEEVLLAFLRLAAPFATMFQEIWGFVSDDAAARGTEPNALRVRFGFNHESPAGIDLEQFRVWAERASRLARWHVQAWAYPAFLGLFEVARAVGPLPPASRGSTDRYYVPGEPFGLPFVGAEPDEFAHMVREVRGALEAVIALSAQQSDIRERSLPELNARVAEGPEDVRRLASLLTDILPGWLPLLEHYVRVPEMQRNEALGVFRAHVEPHLRQTTAERETRMCEPLDILDLPFWRERWRTYEVWATVRTLRELAEYRPRLRVVDGCIPFDGPPTTVIADLDVDDAPGACVAVQHETSYRVPPRKAIRPDLCICFDAAVRPESPAAVIEIKQRARLTEEHVREVGQAYRDGAPRAGGVLILNYDDSTPAVTLPRIQVIGGVRPGNPGALRSFSEALQKVLNDARFLPHGTGIVALLDVSGSMGVAYSSDRAQMGLRQLLALPWVKVFRFNDGLLAGGDSSQQSDRLLVQTGGGTNLAAALRQARNLITPSEIHRLLLVTDGDYGDAMNELASIPSRLECTPEDLSRGVEWLGEREGQP